MSSHTIPCSYLEDYTSSFQLLLISSYPNLHSAERYFMIHEVGISLYKPPHEFFYIIFDKVPQPYSVPNIWPFLNPSIPILVARFAIDPMILTYTIIPNYYPAINYVNEQQNKLSSELRRKTGRFRL